MKDRNVRSLFVAIVLSTVATVFGCNESLVPAEELGEPFSLYGVITPELDTQSVRVYPIESFLTEQDAGEIEDIQVTSTHVGSGTTRIWEDSVIVAQDGQAEFVFWSPFRAAFGATYLIEATRISEDNRTSAEVSVPGSVDIEIVDPRPQGIDVAVTGESIRALKPQVQYVIQAPSGPPRGYTISYSGQETRIEGGWNIEIRAALEREMIQGWYNLDTGYTQSHCGTVYLRALQLDVLVGNKPWNPPGGVFDPNVLVKQRTMSNVENGFGFVGAGYHEFTGLQLSRDLVEGACFLYAEQ